MARVPTYISDERVGGNLPEGAGRVQVTPEAMGAGIGQAQQALGAQVTQAGVIVGNLGQEFQKKQNALETANGVGNADFSKTYTAMQGAAAADGKDFQLNVGNAYDAYVDNYTNGLKSSATVRAAVKAQLVSQKPGYMRQAAEYENRVLDANDKINTNTALATQENIVRSNADISVFYDAEKKQHAVIDAQPGATEVQKIGQRNAASQILGKRRFEGMIASAENDPIAMQGVKNELESETWKRRLSGQDYDRLLDSVDQKMKSANSAEVAAGRAALQDISHDNREGNVIDPTRLKAATDVMRASNKPELISQAALIEKQQEIYRNGKQLTLAEQRAERDKAANASGITALPEPVQRGIAAGVAATNGAIPAQYLGGLAHAEYGHLMKTGDFSRPTGNTTSDGKPGSDATGVAQFTSPTFLATVRAHPTELGGAGLTDAQILEKRKDPEFSMKAAALHALDNKRTLEGELGRPVSEGDLYFAHFLGPAGARRFLRAADANPQGLAKDNVDAGQVDANRPVFVDPISGKPRTNEQVRAYVADKMMNGMSRVDYAGREAWDRNIRNTEKGLNDDPVTFARNNNPTKFADVGDLSKDGGFAHRGVAARQIAEYYGVPTRDFKPLTKEEVEQLGKTVKDGTADETTGVLRQVAGMGGDMAQAAFKQLGEKDTVFGHAAGLATINGQFGVASDIIRGEKRIKEDKDTVTRLERTEPELVKAFSDYVGGGLANTKEGTNIRKAAIAHFVATQTVSGNGAFNKDGFEKSIDAVLGGGASPDGKAIGKINGAATVLPRGLTETQFTTAINRMTIEDYSRLSELGGAPVYSDGKPASAKNIADEGKFASIGNGRYNIRMGDGGLLASGVATMPDGSKRLVPYVFAGDPAALTEFAARPFVPSKIMAPAVPGVQPAQPRVIGEPEGQLYPGNIDLTNRPRVKNADGSVSTVRSITVEMDGQHFVLPTVSEDGRIMSNDEAVKQYRETGRQLGIFKTAKAAEAYAQRLHEDQAKLLKK